MSTELYNRYTFTDLNGFQDPYVNSSLELGFFGNIGAATANTWNSMPTNLGTNNGIATVDASSGLSIFSPGIYTLNVSIDFATAAATEAFFCFTTSKQVNIGALDITNTFGGVESSGMFSFGSNSTTYPGIISWTTNAYNIGNPNGSKLLISTANRLIYSYAFTNTSGTFNQGICTTKITFIIDQPTTIYFNTFCAVALTMGNSYFTLQLIYGLSYTYNNFIQTAVSIGTKVWTDISTSSTGQYVYACANGGKIYRSSNYGVTWSLYINTINTWRCISTSGDGNKVSAGTLSTGFVSDLYYWTNGSLTRTTTNETDNDPFVSTIMSSDGTKTWSVTKSGKLYYSINFLDPSGAALGKEVTSMANASDASLLFYSSPNSQLFKSSYTGANITSLNSPVTSPVLNWQGIATDTTGTYLAAVAYGGVGGGIYTSSDGGTNWIQRIFDGGNWKSIASTANGYILAATNATSDIVSVSTNYGATWSNTSITNANSVTISPNGKTICVAAISGYIYYALVSSIFPKL